jgi:hypothetical protein
MPRLRPAQTEKEEATRPACGRLENSAGEALDAARAGDRQWRKRRNAAMQRRIDRAVRLGKLGHRMRDWSWRYAFGGAILFVLAQPAGTFVELERLAAVLMLGSVAAVLFGVSLLPLSKVLRVTSRVWRRRLLRQAKRNHLEVREPIRSRE